VVPAGIHEFFATSAGVAGALIGLLFVAMSVTAQRLARSEPSSQVHRIRASAALTAFINALAVSLFALLPGHKIGLTSLIVAISGLTFVAASLLSLIRLRQVRWSTVRDGLALAALAVTFVLQLLAGLSVNAHPGDSGSVENIAILVIVCFLIGIARAWELIGGPSFGIGHEVVAMVRANETAQGGESSAETPDAARSAEAPRAAEAAAPGSGAAPSGEARPSGETARGGRHERPPSDEAPPPDEP
jgi:hypothetical protein